MDSSESKVEQNWLERVFALDLRSLAVFRIALGSLILIDLAFRWPTLVTMYTGEGFFTKTLAHEYFRRVLGENWSQFAWSFYWLSDSPQFVTTLFAVAAFAAMLLITGKWTRTATIISWLLLASLHIRNPLVTTSGDFMFKMMLFWSIFLPLGARWSIDSNQMKPKATEVCSFATVGYIVQLFAIYFFPGIAKWNEIWLSGDAMWYVLRLDIYITEFGRAMLDYPSLLGFVSWATLAAEVFWIWTLFIPWKNGWFRLANMAVFWMFHIGIALSLTIGLFPWICMIAWLPLLPAFIWKKNNSIRSTESNQVWSKLPLTRLAAELFCLTTLALVLVWNVSYIETPFTKSMRIPVVAQIVNQMGINQHFQMFGDPPRENPWFVYEARLVDGTDVDIFRNRDVDTSRPEWGRKEFPQFHWRKLHRNALHKRNDFIRQPLLDHAVREWNKNHSPEKQVVRARLLFFQEGIGPDYNEQNFASIVWGHYEDKSKSAGSLFDSLLKDDDNPF